MAVSSRDKSNDQHLSTRQSPLSSTSASTATFFARANSPNRARFYRLSLATATATTQSSPSVRLSMDNRDRTISPGRSISLSRQYRQTKTSNSHRKTCTCSPTTHPGSFRCAFHRSLIGTSNVRGNKSAGNQNRSSCRAIHFRRSAMTNSLLRIGGVEGELVKTALSALIRPSSHQLRRRADFQRRPSPLSVMSMAEGL